MTVASVLLLLLLALLIVESIAHSKSIKKIDNRILVNGTRGKSTVVKYLAAALSDGNNTMAKITGVIPTLIVRDQKKIINRRGAARIQEQFRIIRAAAKQQCHNLILECMSINPSLQKTESKFFKPHIYVITNTRDDHREVKVSSGISYGDAVIEAIPENSIVVTTKGSLNKKMRDVASQKNSRILTAEDGLTEKYDIELPEEIFEENLSITLMVCEILNIDIEKAFYKILEKELHQSSQLNLLSEKPRLMFLNGFDVNDTESASIFLDKWLARIGEVLNITILLNTRSDRPMRTKVFIPWITRIPGLSKVIITGNHSKYAERNLRKAGIDKNRIVPIQDREIKSIRELILGISEDKTLILAIGNIAGDGHKILETLT